MNNERDTADARLSRSYREIARETAPERLNRAVLDQARNATRPRYARSRAWTRPLAWAATVGLSVALVLELTRVPAPDDQLLQAPASAPVERRQPVVDVLEEDVPQRVAPAESASPAVAADSAGVAKTGAAEQRQSFVDDEMKRERTAGPLQSQPTVAAPAANADFASPDDDILGRADRLAEAQYSDNREVAAASLRSEAAGCPEDAIRSPESWLECIAELEKVGLADAAEQQRQALRDKYPDFELP